MDALRSQVYLNIAPILSSYEVLPHFLRLETGLSPKFMSYKSRIFGQDYIIYCQIYGTKYWFPLLDESAINDYVVGNSRPL